MNDEILTLNLRDASRLTGLSQPTLRRLCMENKLRHARLQNGESNRRTYLIYRDSLSELVQPYQLQQTQQIKKPVRKAGRPSRVHI